MATIVTRSGKGSPLTHAEVDANFTNLNTDKLELSGGTMTGNLSFGNSVKATFGASADLQIYHDGTYSRIYDSSVNLVIGGEYVVLQKADGTDNYLRAAPNAEVKIYYDGSEKLATTSTGVDITGVLSSDGLTVDGQGIFQTSTGASLLTLKSTDSSISGGESIQMDWVYGDTANSTSWRQLSRYAGNQFQWFSNIDDAGYNLRMNLYEGGDFALYEDTGTTAKFFWDASAESLGIGTSSPAYDIHIKQSASYGLGVEAVADDSRLIIGNVSSSWRIAATYDTGGSFQPITFFTSDTERMRIDNSGNTIIKAGKELRVNRPDDATYGAISHGASGTGIVYNDLNGDGHHWQFAGSEKMRIDSSGNLLVGKTGTTNLLTTAGHVFYGNGEAFLTRAGTPLFLGRTGSDGSIVNFYKDGTTVGSIGSQGGDALTVGSGDTGLLFTGANDAVHPWNTSTNASRDGAIDLGRSSQRFKDLYLSGGVYLGGTAAGNALDDYEEGTWTATLTNITGGSLVSANYVKVGRLVTVFITFTCTAAPTANSSRFSLPFTPDGPNIFGHGSWSRGTVEGGVLEVQSSNAVCYFAESGSSSGTYIGTATYQTS